MLRLSCGAFGDQNRRKLALQQDFITVLQAVILSGTMLDLSGLEQTSDMARIDTLDTVSSLAQYIAVAAALLLSLRLRQPPTTPRISQGGHVICLRP